MRLPSNIAWADNVRAVSRRVREASVVAVVVELRVLACDVDEVM